jgi:hypothetical protein
MKTKELNGKTETHTQKLNKTSIEKWAFTGSHCFRSITIPESVKNIETEAFSGCEGLRSINVECENQNYISENGVLFNKRKDTLICYPRIKGGDYVIPNSVANIENYAFDGCNLTSVTIPNSIISIGDYTFCNCHRLTTITNHSLVPIHINSCVFIPQSECTLKVPKASVSAYKNADVWKEFNIVGIEEDNE